MKRYLLSRPKRNRASIILMIVLVLALQQARLWVVLLAFMALAFVVDRLGWDGPRVWPDPAPPDPPTSECRHPNRLTVRSLDARPDSGPSLTKCLDCHAVLSAAR